jgi:2,3-bisphosphoglycerate-dependent phosphoglycerate mutase
MGSMNSPRSVDTDVGCKSVRLILVRHGESEWNRDNRFAGWADIALTDRGVAQMHELGCQLFERGYVPDVAFVSRLQRSYLSSQHLCEGGGWAGLLCHSDWRLNERHYGKLTGMSKLDAVQKYGLEPVRAWRRSYSAVPPVLDSPQNQTLLNQHYADLPSQVIPAAESLSDVVNRTSRMWVERIRPILRCGNSVLVTAHGNSLRALATVVEGLTPTEAEQLEIPNASALVYEVMEDESLRCLNRLTSKLPNQNKTIVI